jgi:hypothetical protein
MSGDVTNATARAAFDREQRTALCCECGEIRMSSHWGAGRPGECAWPDDPDRRPGVVVTRKCAHCGRQTRHAIIRGDAGRDWAEETEHRRLAWEAEQADGLAREIQQLENCGVIVRYIEGGADSPVSILTQFLDDGRFAIALNDRSTPFLHRSMLERAWQVLLHPEGLDGWIIELATDELPPRRWMGYRARDSA